MTLFAFTGASGGSKSSVIDALAEMGYRTPPEIGRTIVKEQIAPVGRLCPIAIVHQGLRCAC